VVLEDVAFAGRSADLERSTGLADLAVAIAALPRGSVVVEAFVDATSDHEGDERLSRSMAGVVVDRLAALGVARSRLVPTGRGSEAPLTPNFTSRGRATNRRVEARVLR
jgi:outer membrane protein OmpA-like peptidoglycan-associated protein